MLKSLIVIALRYVLYEERIIPRILNSEHFSIILPPFGMAYNISTI